MADEFEFFGDDDWEYEYVSEEDVAEENGCFIDDDGNWIPMDEEVEDALYEAREHLAWINQLKKKYAKGKPVPAPKEEWPEMIKAWKATEEAKQPWFHLCYWTGLGQHEYTQKIRDALTRHGFLFDEDESECGEYEIGVESAMGNLLNDLTEGREEEVLDTITISDGVPYRDGLPAPVYSRYVEELEEYSWLPDHSASEYSVHVNSIGELEVSERCCPFACRVEQDENVYEKVACNQVDNSQAEFTYVETEELPF